MFQKFLSAMFAALAVAVLVTACGGGGGYDPGYSSWYDVFGNRCDSRPGPGCNFYANGYKITDVKDPYFNDYYALQNAKWKYTNSNGVTSYYTGWAWLSPSGILYDYYGSALNNKSGEGRDFGAETAEQESNAVTTAGEAFAAKYQLEKSVGIQVAKVMKDYADLGKTRARTEADIADFSQRLYGQDLNKIKGALAEAMKGNKDQAQEMLNETAAKWKTTPERMKSVIKGFYGKEAGQLL